MSRKDGILRQQSGIPHFTSTVDFESYLPTSPILSSKELNWQSLMVRAYHEPSDLEETFFPAGPDVYLVLVTSGAVQVDQRKLHGPWATHHIHEGDWFLTPPGGEAYALRWKSLSTESLRTLHLHLKAELFSRTIQQIVDDDPAHIDILDCTGFQDPLLAHIGLSLQRELQHPASASVGRLYAETSAQMLAVHLLRHYTTTNPVIRSYGHGLSSHQMRRLTTFILDNINQKLSLETLAEQVGFSPYHFSRLFRQATGESPHQFVLRHRMEAAQRLLEKTELPLMELALQVGFPNPSHFTQVFKRYLGVTPLVYRQQH